MGTEYWVLSIIAIMVALVIGFVGGRLSAPRHRQVEAMEQERDSAREEAEAVRAEVNRHFEESARMFGKLASDYRTFFQQFAQTAQNLGLSEGRARELLEEADPNLVARQAGKPDGTAAAAEAPPAGSDPAVDPASASTAAGAPEAVPTGGTVDERTETDEPTPSGGDAASDGDERPRAAESDAAPSDHDAERAPRG